MLHFHTDLPVISYEMYYVSEAQRFCMPSSVFLCLLKGDLKFYVPSHANIFCRLTQGDILYLPEAMPCHLFMDDTCLVLCICLHPWLLHHSLGEKSECIQRVYSEETLPQKSSLNMLIAQLLTACLNYPDFPNCITYAKAYELLHYVKEHCLLPEPEEDAKRRKAALQLRQLSDYLEEHYMMPISLKDAADTLSFTPQYLSNFLKKNLGVTFGDYLNRFRLAAAKVLLRSATETPARIAVMCGFPNQASFQKIFREATSCSPEDYREQILAQKHYENIRGIPVTSSARIRDFIFNFMNYDATPHTAVSGADVKQFTISSHNAAPLKRPWNFMINLGSARDYEKPTFRNQLHTIQDELHFQYGRCTEVFSLLKIYEGDEGNTYDFSRLFRLIDFLYSIHLKPFLDLDIKPFRLYKEPDTTFSDYQTFLSANDYDDFFFPALPEFIAACILRYGVDEFSTWKFELWRRYNNNMTSLESPADFCSRFQRTAAILKKLAPDAALGGPGFNGFLDAKYFSQILEAFQKAPYQPDFISAYYFPYIPAFGNPAEETGGYRAATSPYAMVQRVSEWKIILNALGFEGTPFYITEYSAHLTLENYINDSPYPALYIFHQNVQNYGNVDALSYWLATDLSLAYGNPSSPLIGGNGLMTKHGIRKAGFFAHEFLNRMGKNLLLRNEHLLATSSPDGSYQILFYHFELLRQSFADVPFSQVLLQSPFSAFEDSRPLELSVTIQHIAPGRYRIQEWSLNLNHGNVLNAWGQLGNLPDITDTEIRYMEYLSYPSMRLHLENIENSYQVHTTLNHNEARMIILVPYN